MGGWMDGRINICPQKITHPWRQPINLCWITLGVASLLVPVLVQGHQSLNVSLLGSLVICGLALLLRA